MNLLSNSIVKPEKDMVRDNKFLEERMYYLWDNYFADVPRKNYVLIKFGKASRRQLGSIKWANRNSKIKKLLNKKQEEWEIQDDPRISIITVTKHFKHPDVPTEVIDMTIAHEMVHYTHGFHSPLPKLFRHPHKGNIVNKELIARGLGSQLERTETWLKNNWVKIISAV